MAEVALSSSMVCRIRTHSGQSESEKEQTNIELANAVPEKKSNAELDEEAKRLNS